MRGEIHDLQRRLGVTTVYVTHDQTEAMTLGDRVAVMQSGRLQQVATPQGLYERPVNEFVAGFIGSPSINLLEAELASSNGGLEVRFGEHTFESTTRSRVATPSCSTSAASSSRDPSRGHRRRELKPTARSCISTVRLHGAPRPVLSTSRSRQRASCRRRRGERPRLARRERDRGEGHASWRGSTRRRRSPNAQDRARSRHRPPHFFDPETRAAT